MTLIAPLSSQQRSYPQAVLANSVPAACTPTPAQHADWFRTEQEVQRHCSIRGARTWHIQHDPEIVRVSSRQTRRRRWGPDLEAISSWDGTEKYFAFDVKSQAAWHNGRRGLQWTVNADARTGMARYAMAWDVPFETLFFVFQPFAGGTPYILGINEIDDAPLEEGDGPYWRIDAIDMQLKTLDFLLGPPNPWAMPAA